MLPRRTDFTDFSEKIIFASNSRYSVVSRFVFKEQNITFPPKHNTPVDNRSSIRIRVCRMKFFQKRLFHLICARHRRTFSFRFAAAVIVCVENNFINTARYGPGFECEPHAVIANEHARWRKPPPRTYRGQLHHP